MISGFKYATISDGSTTVTLNVLLPSSSYNKTPKTKKDVDDKLNVIEEFAKVVLVSPNLADTNQLRDWMIAKTAITAIKIYGPDFRIDWLESSKILLSNLIPAAVGGRILIKVSAQLKDESLSSITVIKV